MPRSLAYWRKRFGYTRRPKTKRSYRKSSYRRKAKRYRKYKKGFRRYKKHNTSQTVTMWRRIVASNHAGPAPSSAYQYYYGFSADMADDNGDWIQHYDLFKIQKVHFRMTIPGQRGDGSNWGPSLASWSAHPRTFQTGVDLPMVYEMIDNDGYSQTITPTDIVRDSSCRVHRMVPGTKITRTFVPTPLRAELLGTAGPTFQFSSAKPHWMTTDHPGILHFGHCWTVQNSATDADFQGLGIYWEYWIKVSFKKMNRQKLIPMPNF